MLYVLHVYGERIHEIKNKKLGGVFLCLSYYVHKKKKIQIQIIEIYLDSNKSLMMYAKFYLFIYL